MRPKFLFLFAVVFTTALHSGAATSLHFPFTRDRGFGLTLSNSQLAGVVEQPSPAAIQIISQDGSAKWINTAYSSVHRQTDGSRIARAAVTTPAGSVFEIEDRFSKEVAGGVGFKRVVTVVKASKNDIGFSSRFALEPQARAALSSFDVFVPSVWYRQNSDVPKAGLASDMTAHAFWFREDRLPLPMIMMRNRASGLTLSIFHSHQDGRTFTGEDGLERIIDERMKFGAIGLDNDATPSMGFIYPGSEGDKTGVTGMSEDRRWSLRSHPVKVGLTQSYDLEIELSKSRDFEGAMTESWKRAFQIQSPAVYQVDLSKIYFDQMALLNRYWNVINDVPGVPFAIRIDGVATDQSRNMGFVGQQIANAALMINDGFLRHDVNSRERGEKTIEWWVTNSLTENGCPQNWYDPYKKTWYPYETYMRVVGDGMNGLLRAWNFERGQSVSRPAWLETARRSGEWLSSIQASDGSFPRAVDCGTGQSVHGEKNNTSHVIEFLVQLYFATKQETFKAAALSAGNFVYTDSHLSQRYVGGTPDHPNVPDKEAAALAMRAFLSLYDLTADRKWLSASLQAAHSYQTWIYAWNVPIPEDDVSAQFPKHRSTTGLSPVATASNHADTYMAIDAFQFYRLYLLTGEEQLRATSLLALYNSKQYVNWDPLDPNPGFGDPGLLGEAMTVTLPRGHGTPYFLPWQSYNLIEPLIDFQTVFGSYKMKEIEKISLARRRKLNLEFGKNRGFSSP